MAGFFRIWLGERDRCAGRAAAGATRSGAEGKRRRRAVHPVSPQRSLAYPEAPGPGQWPGFFVYGWGRGIDAKAAQRPEQPGAERRASAAGAQSIPLALSDHWPIPRPPARPRPKSSFAPHWRRQNSGTFLKITDTVYDPNAYIHTEGSPDPTVSAGCSLEYPGLHSLSKVRAGHSNLSAARCIVLTVPMAADGDWPNLQRIQPK